MLLASSGILPDDLRFTGKRKATNFCAQIVSPCSQSEQNARAPNCATLLAGSRDRDHEFAVLFGDEVL
jgi:hypothetical protein